MDEYLETLPEAVLSHVFENPKACIVILRLLPPLAKSIVMRMLSMPSVFPLSCLTAYLQNLHTQSAHSALYKLKSMKIVREKYVSESLELNGKFQASLLTALGINASPQHSHGFDASQFLSSELLNNVFNEKWESMLNFMVSSTDLAFRAPPPSAKIANLVSRAGLLSRSGSITADGFQFLLQSRSTQVWQLLLHILNNSHELDAELVDILTFLFSLAASKVGSPQPMTDLSVAQQKLVHEIAGLGLVYTNGDVFYATTDLSQPHTPGLEKQGFLIAETNYRIYAYTDSPLQISILSLFCNVKARFANLVICRLTRTSARRALKSGITADQIVEYLSSNHRGKLPSTIQDQVRLWQLEMDRFRQADGVLFRDFVSSTEYLRGAKYAEDIGALLWKCDKRRMFFVTERSAASVGVQFSH